jgi:hypothetical protein
MKKIILVIFVLCGAMSLSGCILPPGGPEEDPAVVLAVDTFMGQTSVKVFITAIKTATGRWPF